MFKSLFAISAAVCLLILPGRCPAQANGVTTMKVCTALPQPRSQHGCAVVGNRLYVLGGYADGPWEEGVFSTPILSAGELGEWRTERAMPEKRSYIGTSVEVVDNRIYVVGGALPIGTGPKAGLKHAQDVLWTSVQSDGSLAEWQRSIPYPGPAVSCSATCSTGKSLYLVGGSTAGDPSDAILRSDFASDGMPMGWSRAGTLPKRLWFHGATILGDRMYVWGGLPTKRNDTANQQVYSAPLLKEGLFGEWREETPMPAGIYSSAFCGFNDYLLGVSGRYVSGHPTNVIWYSRLENGKVGPWQMIKTDLESMVYLSLGLDRGRGVVYVVGGQHKTKPGGGIEKVLQKVQAFSLASR